MVTKTPPNGGLLARLWPSIRTPTGLLRFFLLALGCALVHGPVFAAPPKALKPAPLSWQKAPPNWKARAVAPNTRGRTRLGLVDLARWAAEPPAPAPVDKKRLADALRAVCPWMPARRPGPLGRMDLVKQH